MTWLSLLEIAGRFLLGATFVVGGIQHIFEYSTVSDRLRGRGMPWPELALGVGTIFQIASGALLAVGIFQRIAAVGLIAFTLVASAIVLNFWDLSGSARRGAMLAWQSNVGIIGGLLLLAST